MFKHALIAGSKYYLETETPEGKRQRGRDRGEETEGKRQRGRDRGRDIGGET